MKRIAIIPARSGSKGLKDKNIIDLWGKPMIAYSIEAAMKSGIFDKIIVSTDSRKYGKIAEQYGAEVIYRDEKLSNDLSTTFEVIKDVLEQVKEKYDLFMLLQPTSPMRDEKHIIGAIKAFEEKLNDYDFMVSVKETEHAAVLVKPIEEDLSLKHFDVDFSSYRRQDYKEYCPNGAIFIGKPEQYIRKKHFFGEKSMAYIMTAYDSIDVDNELDYKIAQIVMKEKMERETI